MEAIFSTFGIDWRLLLVQGVNFGVLLLGLTYFLYKPVMGMLDERERKVVRGVEDAEAAATKLAAVEAERSSALAQAGREADSILAQARSAAEAQEREILAHAERAALALAEGAAKEAQETKAHALTESREEIAKLIVLGVEKMLTHK